MEIISQKILFMTYFFILPELSTLLSDTPLLTFYSFSHKRE